MSVIAALQYLSRSEDGDDDGDTERQLTPLDPEYWRGITHSHEEVAQEQYAATAAANAHHHHQHQNHHGGSGHGYAPQIYADADYLQIHHPHRPVTAPGHMIGGAYGSTLVPSPIHFAHSARSVPISPMAHAEHHAYGYGDSAMAHSYSGGFGAHTVGGSFAAPFGHSGLDYGHAMARGGGGYASAGGMDSAMSPQSLKAELRSAFVRARAYIDLVPFFQSCDRTYSGGIPLRTLHEALLQIGLVLPRAWLQTIQQLFGAPGSGLINYVAFSRFLELDQHEMYVATRLQCLSGDLTHDRSL